METITLNKNNISWYISEMVETLKNVNTEQFKYMYIIPCSNEMRTKLIEMWWEMYNSFWDIRIPNNL